MQLQQELEATSTSCMGSPGARARDRLGMRSRQVLGKSWGAPRRGYHAEPPLGYPQLTRVGQPSPALRVIKNEASDRFVLCVC